MTISNLVYQTSTTTGTGNFTLSSLTAWRTFNDAFGTGGSNVFHYFIRHKSAAEWEVGTGHLSSSTVLVRDTVIASSNSNNAVNFSAGDKDIVNDLPATLQAAGPGSSTDNAIARWDSTTGRLLQNSSATIDDSGNITVAQASAQPTSPINNPPYALVIDYEATNLFPNPSAEVDLTGMGSATGANASISRVTTEKYIGDASMRVLVSPSGSGQGWVSSAISVDASETYIFSVWLKVASGTTSVVIRNTGDNSGATSLTISVDTVWRRFWINKTMSGSDTTSTLRLITAGATTLDMYVDGIFLEKNATGTPSNYLDGSLGVGHEWTGTAHNSASTRAGGVHVLSKPISGGAGLSIDQNGYIRSSGAVFIADRAMSGYGLSMYGSFTTLGAFGLPGGVIYIENDQNGIVAHLKSGVTTDMGVLLEFGSLTSGTGIAIAAPSDKTTMIANGGLYFKFFDKSNKNDLQVGPELVIMGSNNQNIRKRLQIYGGGAVATATTAKTGTVGWNSTTVTGSGTSFTTEYAIGDVMVIAGQNAIIRAIASNTSLTTTAAASPTVSTGTAHARRDDQYRPPVIFLSDSSSDQLVAAKAGLVYGLWPTNSGHLKFKTATLTSPAQTLSTTSGSTAFTTSSNVSGLVAGDWVFSNGMEPRQVFDYSGTSGNFRRAASATVTTAAFRYRESDDVTAPTSDTDSNSSYVSSRAFRDTSKSIGSTSSPTSIFNTAPIIPGGAFSTDRILRIKGALNITAGLGGQTLDLQFGGSSILINTAETAAAVGHMVFEIVIAADGSTSQQQCSLSYILKADTNGATIDMGQVTAQTAVNTSNDNLLDIFLDSSVAITTTVRYIYGEWV